MAYTKGDVILVPYPYSDLTATKVRPSVVVSSARYHQEQPDLLLAALTSNVAAATASLDYILQDWQAVGLRFSTAFKPVVATLEPHLVVHRIGALTPRDLAEVEKRLRLALAL